VKIRVVHVEHLSCDKNGLKGPEGKHVLFQNVGNCEKLRIVSVILCAFLSLHWDDLILLFLVHFNNKGKGNDAVSSVLVVCKHSLIF